MLGAGSASLTSEQQIRIVSTLTQQGVARDSLVTVSRGVAGLCPQAKDLLFQRFAQHPNLASKLSMVTAMAPHFSSLNDGERNLLMQVATGPIANLANRDAVSSQYHAIAALGHSINKM